MRTLFTAALLLLPLTVACGDKDDDTGAAECAADQYQCADAEILQECVDGAWSDAEDCAALGLMCHAEMGHCMEME